MSEKAGRPEDIESYTGLNRLLKSKALQFIINKISDGTFEEFIGDWKWIFSYSRRYVWMIVFYTVLGIVSSTLSLGASVVSKYLVDIVTGRDVGKLGLLICVMIGSTVFSLVSAVW